MSDPKTTVAGFLIAKIPQNIQMNLNHIGFSQGVISTLFNEPSAIQEMPFGVLAGEILGNTNANAIGIWDVRLFGKTSYAGLLIGKAQNLSLQDAFAVGRISYNNDTQKPAQKYIGGLIGGLTQSSLTQVYSMVGFQFTSNYAYSANRIGALVGEAEATTFTAVYTIVNTYSSALVYEGTHFLQTNTLQQNINWTDKFWQNKFILPFGFGSNNAEIQKKDGRKIVYKDKNDLCTALSTWTKKYVQIKETDLFSNSFKICLPVWTDFKFDISTDFFNFYISTDSLLQ